MHWLRNMKWSCVWRNEICRYMKCVKLKGLRMSERRILDIILRAVGIHRRC